MDYALLPPEINSARMYTGPGSGSMMAAATSWDMLAAELATTAETYESVVSGLNSMQWRGTASDAMTAAVVPYVGWLYATAERTQQTAMQARAAAGAFEQAFVMTVPPPLIAANRAQLMALIATNFFGQNTAAIAATEAQYAEMWAQDAAAMYAYAASSAAATTMLTPFASAQQNTNPAGLTAQGAAVTQAEASAAPLSPLEQLANLLGQIPIIGDILSSLNYLEDQIGLEDFTPFASAATSALTSPLTAATAFIAIIQSAAQAAAQQAGQAAFDFSGMAPALVEGLAPVVNALKTGSVGSAISAAVGKAGSIGPLSVPTSWTAPATGHVSALAPAGLTTFTGTEEAAGPGMPGVPGVPVGALARGSGVLPRYGVRLTVMAHPPAAG
ncbi:PPE family protein [Mycobacterium terramassiliense]|uniref:PPE family protein n=1 Tax=Mycobacterium terramassiliense TaxID=1841859 RepID=A0A2U3NJ49_9MYCO|nr:PPE family protein [Mycobacterium terramassiliense]SPM31464.1 PPE family protein [Mycobacterium terramassiliense]